MIVALAMVMTLLVLAGLMPTIANGRIVVNICIGTGAETTVVEIPDMAQHAPNMPAKPEAPRLLNKSSTHVARSLNGGPPV